MKKTEFLKVIIIILILIVIGLLVYLLNPLTRIRLDFSYINDVEKFDIETLTLGNTHVWHSIYDGNVDSIIVDKSVYYFATNIIPKYYKIDDPQSYYQKNSKSINLYTGIDTEKDFINLVNTIKALNTDNPVLEKYSIFEDSATKTKDGVKAILGIQYEQNNKILFTITIKDNVQDGKTSVIYSTEVEDRDKYNTERDESIVSNQIDPSKPGRVIK